MQQKEAAEEVTQLTEKQRTFISEYLIDLNGTQAAIRAGYSPHTANEQASRLLAKANIAKLIQEAMDKRSEDLGIDARYVLKSIKTTMERCSQAYPVLDRKGEPVMVSIGEGEDARIVPAYAFDANGVLKGAELLGKHLKLFTDKTEITGKDGAPIDHNVKVEFINP
jgi:phage terminase small subunit